MRYAKKTGYVLALILFLIFTAGPFVWTFILSVTPEHAMFTGDGGLLPETVIWDNYTELFSGGQRGSRFFVSLGNSPNKIFPEALIIRDEHLVHAGLPEKRPTVADGIGQYHRFLVGELVPLPLPIDLDDIGAYHQARESARLVDRGDALQGLS